MLDRSLDGTRRGPPAASAAGSLRPGTVIPSAVLPLTMLVSLAVAWLLTSMMRRYALARHMLDHPNERSSHTVPTPRGGGVGIAIPVLVTTLLATGWELVPLRAGLGVASGGALVAGIGWWDDYRGLSAATRATVHFAAAAWVVFWLGGLPVLGYGSGTLSLGPFGGVLAVVGIVWLTNLFNFMDGIDGIAAGEAVCASLGAAVVLVLAGSHGLAVLAVGAAGAAGGFLAWNWAPARIFMGDVGSGFLGFFFGSLAVASQNAGVPLPVWFLLLGVFLVDATITLLRRMARGARWYAAHREHAYQRAVQAGWSHAQVAGVVVAVNVVLGVLAVAAYRTPAALPWILGAALLILTGVYVAVERIRAMG